MKTISYLKRIRSLPPKIVVQKLFRKIKKKIEAGYRRKFDEKLSTYESRFIPPKELPQFIKPLDLALVPQKAILDLCRCYMRHEFNLLGSGWVKVFPGMDCLGIGGIKYPPIAPRKINEKNRSFSDEIRKLISENYQPIDWHIDFKSGYRWKEDTWSQDIRYGTHIGADIKVPWELARMQHLVMLAWGYALEKSPAYIQEFQDQLLDFIASNPPRYGVNWSCTMDVGIRIANWLFAYDLFRAYKAQFEPQFEKIFFQSIYEHGKHIYTHLEWDPHLRMNHYLANITGLLFAAVYLDNPRWLQFAIRELKAETLSQFNPDGSNFEGSTCYHRLSAEMVLCATALAQELGTVFPEEHFARMAKMANFIRDITKPDGTVVQIGDNDSGRFLKLFPDSDDLDHRYLMGPLQRCRGLTSVIQNQLEPHPQMRSQAKYPDFGLYIYRKDPWYLAIRCGPLGQRGNGGHSHNDQLSFELAVNGLSMLIDPGTYVYTPFPEKRKKFRSTSSHNTLALEGLEQNREEDLFRMTDKARSKVLQYEEGLFCGEHQGFGFIHRRTIHIQKNSIVGIDECDASPKEIHFHLDPKWTVKQFSNQECHCFHGSLLVRVRTDHGIFDVSSRDYSKGYGNSEKMNRLTIHTNSKRIAWSLLT